MNRRRFIHTNLIMATALGVPSLGRAAESDLIYVSPLHADGSLSSCQAEVWYVEAGGSYYVVTASDAWRAQAVGRGLTRAQVWVGNVGQWKSAGGAYKDLPGKVAAAALESDATTRAAVLARFGEKYAAGWGTWGPRFRNGLSDGSRVMLRYSDT